MPFPDGADTPDAPWNNPDVRPQERAISRVGRILDRLEQDLDQWCPENMEPADTDRLTRLAARMEAAIEEPKPMPKKPMLPLFMEGTAYARTPVEPEAALAHIIDYALTANGIAHNPAAVRAVELGIRTMAGQLFARSENMWKYDLPKLALEPVPAETDGKPDAEGVAT
jgi:hypothetical protein